jgi:hypothetical protein
MLLQAQASPIMEEPEPPPVLQAVPVIEEPIIPKDTYCSCVRTARLFNKNVPLKDAVKFAPNITLHERGEKDFILEKFDDVYHIAYIERISNLGYHVIEGNFRECEYSKSRVIPYNSKNIRGFYRPVL